MLLLDSWFMNNNQYQELLESITKPYLILVTGASGTGKTTIVKAIEKKLNNKLVSFNYFDDIGVPSFESMVSNFGSPQRWQEVTTHAWMAKLTTITDKKLIILEGSFNPEFAIAKLQKPALENCLVICIHTDRAQREARLMQNRNQPELVSQDMENFARLLKERTLALGGVVVEHDKIHPSQTAQSIIELIYSFIQGKHSD
jgi:dephospho-CoA kinase